MLVNYAGKQNPITYKIKIIFTLKVLDIFNNFKVHLLLRILSAFKYADLFIPIIHKSALPLKRASAAAVPYSLPKQQKLIM